MKRMMLAFLMIVLLMCAACAETRQSVIYLEGEPEFITETLYETAWGFSFWYDADLLSVDDRQSESGYSLMLYPAASDLPVYMEFMLPDAIGTTAWELLRLNATEGVEYESAYTEAGTEILGYTKPADFNDEIIQGFYAAASGDDEQVAIFISCPAEAWEGWGARLIHTLQTVSFGPLPAVSVSDWDGAENVRAVSVSDDEYSTWVFFTFRRPVTDFQVLALEMNDEYEFDTQAVCSLGTMTPDTPLTVSLSFYGDMPNNGVSFVDEDGTLCRYAVDMSGEDGSLYLWPF